MLGEARASRCFSSGWCVAVHVAALHRRLTEKFPLRGGDADALRWGENAEHLFIVMVLFFVLWLKGLNV